MIFSFCNAASSPIPAARGFKLKSQKLSTSKLRLRNVFTHLLHSNMVHFSLVSHVSCYKRMSHSYFEYPYLGPLTLKNLIQKFFSKVYFFGLTHLDTSLANMNGNNFSHFLLRFHLLKNAIFSNLKKLQIDFLRVTSSKVLFPRRIHSRTHREGSTQNEAAHLRW